MNPGIYPGALAQTQAVQNPAIPPKELPAHEHACKLHALAQELSDVNDRIVNFLNRFVGPSSEKEAGPQDSPQPMGALLVAQFGAQHISVQIDALRSMVSRLEQIA